MASRGYGYDYGGGGSGGGGKIRRRPTSRAAASPYARPAPAAAAAAVASQGGGWFSRLISAGASRLLPSLFRKPSPQLAAPPQPPPEPLDATHSLPEALQEPLPPRLDVGPAFLREQTEPLDAPPSPPPPPLEDDLPEDERSGAIEYNGRTQSSDKDGEDMQRNSDEHGSLDLEELLKQKTFSRSEFEYLSKLLWSRTMGSSSIKPEDVNMKKMHVSEKENESTHSRLPVDFSIRTYSVADQGASPAEIAKAYMGSKSTKGSPLRLRLHDPSSLPISSMEPTTMQKAKSPTIPLLQGSRLHTSTISDRFDTKFTTPNRSTIYKMSSSPYFKGGANSKDLFGSVYSSYQTPSSVHTCGRQILKRKSAALNNETVSVGPIRKMRQIYNRTSPLLETRPGYRGHLGYGSKRIEDTEQSMQTRKRRCLNKGGDATLGSLDDRAHVKSFGQAPLQSSEMAAKILKQLDTLVPPQKENTPQIKEKHGNIMDVEDHVSREMEVSAQSNHPEPSPSGVKEYSSLNGLNDTPKFTIAEVTEKSVDATSKASSALMSNSFSQTTSKDKPPTSLRSHAPSNLVLSSEIDRNKMPIISNGFTFPVPAIDGTHSQAPQTPTMSSPPVLPVEKQQPSTASIVSVTSLNSGPRVSKSASEEGSAAQICDRKLNTYGEPNSSKVSGPVASFTSKPVFKVVSPKPTTLSNSLEHTMNTTACAVFTANGSTNSVASSSAISSTVSTNSALKSAQSSSTGSSFTFSNTGTGSSEAGSAPSLGSSGAQSGSAPFNFLPKFGTASSSAAQDKPKAVSSNTTSNFSQQFGTASSPSSTPFNFSQQFGTANSLAVQDNSKAASPEPTTSGNLHAKSENINSPFTQSSVSHLSIKSSETSNGSNSQSFMNSPVGSAPSQSPFTAGSLFSSAAGSSSTSATAAFLPSSATSSPFGSSAAFSGSQMFGSKLTTTATPSFGLPTNGATTSVFSSSQSAVFSFTSATPSIPNSSPTTPVFGGLSRGTDSTTVTGQMNRGNMIANESPFSTAAPFAIPTSSPSTPIFSSPATQLDPATSASPEIFKFGAQNPASSAGFSIGPSGGNDRSGRKFVRVKRKK